MSARQDGPAHGRPTSRALTRDVIRDPLYGPIALDETARALIDTPAFQRLRRIRQLSEASALYPSAMHTRFEHSVGVYHLAKTMVAELRERGELGGVREDEQRLVPYAALCHDLGHHVGAHLLEESPCHAPALPASRRVRPCRPASPRG